MIWKSDRVICLFVVLFMISLSACNSSDRKNLHFFVGTYSTTGQAGIYSCALNPGTKQLEIISATFGIENPSFLAISPNQKYLYAVSEVANRDLSNTGSVYAYRIHKKDYSLTEINSVSSGGAHPCHLSVHPSGKSLFVANYSGGNISSVTVNPNGSLNGSIHSVQHLGSGPIANRQEKAHAHSANITPNGNYLFAADLGIDKIIGYQVRTQNGELSPLDEGTVSLATGAGPRHMAFSTDGRFAFVVNELNSTITSCSVNMNSGQLDTLGSVSTLPISLDIENYCADIHVHPGGKFVYASNRGHNSIAVFKIQEDGSLQMVQTHTTLGDWPRNFGISPDGKYLLVANERSGNIFLLEINQETGWLKDAGTFLTIPKPVCIVFDFTIS